MNRRILSFTLVVLAALLLTGCAMRTVEEMYALPKRAEEYSQLQAAIDAAMVNLEYSAPISGENQQTVQSADLDGDGAAEYLVFASGSWEKPLQVLVFKQKSDGNCDLVDIIECNGTAFEQVEYIPFNDGPGLDIVIGCQVSNQVLRSVSVYTMEEGHAQQLMLVGYSRFLTCDLNDDGAMELMVFRPSEMETDPGVSVLYSCRNGRIIRSSEAQLSVTSSRIRRIQGGKLRGGENAVFVSSTVDDGRILCDILVPGGNDLSNLTLSEADDVTRENLQNLYAYPRDIDEDGVMELPAQLSIRPVTVWHNDEEQSLLRWLSLDEKCKETDALYTFHNFQEGWYLELNSQWSQHISVVQGEDIFTFYMWNEDFSEANPLFSIFSFTGNDRSEQAAADGRFLLYNGESTTYAAKLEESTLDYGITRESLTESFRLIRQDRHENE